MRFVKSWRAGLLAAAMFGLPACQSDQSTPQARPPVEEPGHANPAPAGKWPRYTLQAEETWQFNLPPSGRFDASGLLFNRRGELLTLRDFGVALFQVQLKADAGDADLVQIPECFTAAQLAPFAREKVDRYDCEGIAEDAQGRLYLCEEANRWVLRWDPATKVVERLPIDWSSVAKHFDPADRNASFEGIAIGDGRLYLANERNVGRIIAVELATLKVVDDFTVRPSGNNARDLHYTDLSWFEGALWVLLRESRVVLQVNPRTHTVLAEFSYAEMENAPENIYRTIFPTGTMEGLAVDQDHLWLLTDNNGLPRVKYPGDIRPTLFKCPRPDKKK